MSKQTQKFANRMLAIMLAIIMVVGIVPMSIFAVTSSTVETNLGGETVTVGEYVEFTVTTTANDDLGEMVLGYLEFNGGDWSVLDSLQYKESKDGNWYDLPQGVPFGPAGTGFPMSDATSTFRVKFKTAGTYSFSVSMKTVEDNTELCSLSKQVTAVVKPSEITTDITEQAFVVGTAAEFSFTSIPNGHAGEYVFGKFTFSDWDAVETLEYWGVTENQWMPLPKDVLFGPAGTGFPMTQATTRLQVTFNKAGTYTCTVALVKASDTNEVLSSIQSEITVTEGIPPVVEIVSGNPENWTQSVTVTGTVSDEGGSGVVKVVYSKEETYAETHAAATLSEGEFSFAVTENATYYVWAVDGNGNISDAQAVVIDKIDTAPPALDVTVNPDTWTNGVVNIEVSTGDESGVTVKYNTSDSFEDAEELPLDDQGKAVLPVSGEYYGQYYVWAVDAAGNKTEKVVAVLIDTALPIVTITTVPSEVWINGDVTVEGTVEEGTSDIDAISGIDKVVYGTTKNVTDAIDITLNDSVFSFTVTENGTYYIWATDKAGNYSEIAEITIQNIDKVAPVVDSTVANPDAWTNESVTVSGTVSDNASGVAQVVYGTSDQFEDAQDKAELNDDGTYSFVVENTAEFDGLYYVWAIDTAGNHTAEPASIMVQIDTTAPAVDSIVADPNVWTNESVTVSGTVSDNASGVAQVVYGTSDQFEDAQDKAELNDDGTYSFVVENTAEFDGLYYVWAIDTAGNHTAVSASVNVQIDITAPAVDSIVAAPSDWTNQSVIISGTVSDNASGVAKVVYNIENEFDIDLPKAEFNGDGVYSFEVENVAEFDGLYYVWAIDNAGNHTEVSASVNVNIDITAPTITIPDLSGSIFNGDVTVDVVVEDKNIASGIYTIEYWVTKDGVETQRETMYRNDGNDALTSWAEKDIVVLAEKNNSSNVVVSVKVVDIAGNESTESEELDIDVTAPVVEVRYDNHNGTQHNGWYYDDNRTATIVITERDNHFVEPDVFINEDVPAGATNYIHVTAVNGAEQILEGYSFNITWTHSVNEDDPDKTTHTALIEYSTDATFNFDIKVQDAAGNVNESVTTNEQDAPYKFTVDKVIPDGTVTLTTTVFSETWNDILNFLTFGLFDATRIEVTATASDVTSPVKIEYYKVTGAAAETALTDAELKNLQKWEPLVDNGRCVVDTVDVLTVTDNAQFVVYLKLTDYAGNTRYIRSGGAVLDNKEPNIEKVEPQITITPTQQPVNGIYNTDVLVDVKVTEVAIDGAYSGLKSVTYEIYNHSVSASVPSQTGTLVDFINTTPSRADLISEYEKSGAITVEKAKNNSNNVEIKVIVVDNAGNRSEKSIFIKIDTTAPTIDISYNNNAPDSGSYYKDDRIATIIITERNFKAEDVKITITNTDGTIPAIPAKVSDWTEVIGTGNLDDTTYTATITYSADGDYTFDISYADLASNPCAGAVYAAGTQNPTEFTMDQTAPVVSVAYNNNSAQNDKFFNATRTATITIIEHNFPLDDIARVVFTQTTGRGGVIPAVAWTHDGDTHIATFNYTADGDYTFEVAMTDLAGNASAAANYGDTVAGKDFVIDTTFEDMISQEGVENGVAYGHDATVIPNIKISDINLQEYTVTLVGIQKDKTIDLTEEINALLDKGTETVTGIFDIFETKQDLDGIYTLTMTSKDKAGNEDSMQIIFTVNRFGSVYVYEQYLIDLIANGGSYVYSIDEDLIITEYNADKLVTDSLKIEITVDGRPLEDVKFEVTPEINDTVSVGSSGWYQYKYTISKDNFKTDGVYKISVSSKDATGNTPENSNYENMSMSFRVDSTQAEITSIVGLEEAIINAQNVTVKYTVFDTIGLKSIKVYVNGQMVDEITDFSADMNNFNGQFVVNEQTSAQSIRIVVEDMSGNITDTSAEDFSSAYAFNNSVTVSTNMFVRWYADKGLFWGSIAGVVVLAVGVIVLVAAKRKKKEEAAAK